MNETKIRRVLGTGTYTAIRSEPDGLVTLRAVGLLNCANYKAQLEQRPERIRPPFYDMAFYVSDICLPAMLPFDISITVFGSDDSEAITVYDATGSVDVPVKNVFEEESHFAVAEGAADRDEFLVYARLPVGDGRLHGCIVVPADTMVLAIYFLAFGPASKAECEAFAAEKCGTSINVPAVPWPSGDE
ncbi:hypothetical protein [Blastomonas sp.]|uniref:hypothetical protein n=1 Tax=Blastomonas sp. TaxID=1909299 RepID=UPI003593AECA